MKIALINENSQCGKNNLIFETLKKVCEPKGHQVFNYGRFAEDDGYQRSYVQAGLLAGILINSGAADFVITGCGTEWEQWLHAIRSRMYFVDLWMNRWTVIFFHRLTQVMQCRCRLTRALAGEVM